MSILLLLLIYLIFISLGLPDSILGSSFPAIAENLKISVDHAGYIGMVITSCTIVSSFFSDKLVEKFQTRWLILISILLTALGLGLYSFVQMDSIWLFYLAALPLGLGAGCIDACLNNYVALHYKAIHMNWLHCFWGVGASISPFIVGGFINPNQNSTGWEKGVLTVCIIQIAIAVLTFLCLPLWNKVKTNSQEFEREEEVKTSFERKSLFSNSVFYLAVFGFFCYCGMETMTGFWSGNYFYHTYQVDSATAANLTSMFYLGITIGRFISGFISLKVKEMNLIRIGEGLIVIGTILMGLNLNLYLAIAGMILTGIGFAPIYPAIIRLTPYRFSKAMSQKAMGMEMAFAYCGNLIVSPLFGVICRFDEARFISLPYVALGFVVVMIVLHEAVSAKLKKRDSRLTEAEKQQYQVQN